MSDAIHNLIFVSDRGSNMIKGLEKFDNLHCFVHLLNNLVEKICNVNPLTRILDSLKEIVKWFKQTGLDRQLKTTLKTFCPTRFSGYCILIDSVLLNWDDVVQILHDNKKNHLLNGINKKQVQVIFDFLNEFRKASIECEASQKPTLFLVWPWMLKLRIYMKTNENDSVLIARMKDIGLSYLNNVVFKYLTDFHKMAVFLHPELKNLKIISRQDRTDIHNCVKNKIEAMSFDFDANELITPNNKPRNQRTFESSALALFYESESESDSEINSSNFSEIIDREIKKYVEFEYVKTDTFNLLDWWFQHRFEFKYLYKLALKIHSIPASSAAAERCFSNAGRHSKTKPNLGPKTLDNLLFLKSNYDMLSEHMKKN